MRKVFLENLPRWEGYNNNHIKWTECIGAKIHFIYDDIEGYIEIIDYYSKNGKKFKIVTKYNDIIYEMGTTQFIRGNISYCIGLKTNDYRYKIGDVIKTKSGKIKILDCFRKTDIYHKSGEKHYNYQCLIDGNIDIIKESHLNQGIGCNVCYNRKVLKGYNDIATTENWMIEYMVDKNDATLYTRGSKNKILMKCPTCGYQKYIQPDTMLKQGFGCNQCSDGLSYPSKFITCLLNQLSASYIIEYSSDWSKNKRYDYYIYDKEIIIEVNGMQHYDGGFVRARGRTLQQEQENDRLKKELALENSIKEENYIVIDCRKSDLEWIKINIINSKLYELFDLSKVDWLKCHEYACDSLVKQVSDLWNKGIHNTQEISDIIKIHRSTVIRNLKKAEKIGWCNYNPKDEMNKGLIKGTKIMSEINKKRVICLNTNEIFNSLTEASGHYNLKNSSSICGCCRGLNKTAGKHPKTGEPLKWMYYEDYLQLQETI